MKGLQLVRVPVDMRALVAFAVAERVDDDDRGYATHLALRGRFGTAAPQPFRLFENAAAAPYLLGYTVDAPALADAAGLPPIDERLAAVFPEAPSCRAMPDQWRLGARYAFEVRVRPVVRYGPRARAKRRAEGHIDAGERDAFLAAVEKADETGMVDRETVYRAWLLHQMAAAASVEQGTMNHMRRLATHRSSHGRPGRERIEGYDALFAGTLTVQDPGAFTQLLARGVGRHTAFGFGMLALAPPRRG